MFACTRGVEVKRMSLKHSRLREDFTPLNVDRTLRIFVAIIEIEPVCGINSYLKGVRALGARRRKPWVNRPSLGALESLSIEI